MDLRQLDATMRELQSRPGRSIPGPPIQAPQMPGKADDFSNLQKQIDGLHKTVIELLNRVNAAIGQ